MELVRNYGLIFNVYKTVRTLLFISLLPVLLPVPGLAYERDPLVELQLHDQFIGLKGAKDEADAARYANRIWQLWFQSGDAEIDELMQEAMARRQVYDFNGAIEVLNQVIEREPGYPEVWNQRATIYFYQQEYEKSLEDVARTLELEPRHFGALAGRAVIRLNQLKPALARQNVIEALKIHPFLPERQMFPGL